MNQPFAMRPMSTTDIENVIRLDDLAFAEYLRKNGISVPPRTRENIQACLDLNPEGCFVTETDAMIGYLFSRRWGTVGWLGVFGIHPDAQGLGVGWALLLAGVEHLQQAGCTVIGLETMPDSPYNLGFYTRYGFRTTFPTIAVDKKPVAHVDIMPYSLLSQEEPQALSWVTRISQAAWPGLDYAPEADNAKMHGWGETLLIGWPEPWACAVIQTVPKRSGQTEFRVNALAVLPEARQRLPDALQVIETFACRQNTPQIELHINTIDGQALAHALEYGFRVNRLRVRMVWEHPYPCPPGIEMSGWVM